MSKKIDSKEDTFRKRMYEFFSKNKSEGKIFTVNHFIAEKVPRRTIYDILNRIEHSSPKRKPGSSKIAENLTRTKINKLEKAFNNNDKISQRQADKEFECSQLMVSKVLKQNNIQVRHKTKILRKLTLCKRSSRLFSR